MLRCTNIPLARSLSGFSLIELLVVVSILVSLVGLTVGFYYSAGEAAEEQVARAQMAELAKALRAFRADTGYFPREGPFALVPAGTEETGTGEAYSCVGVVGGGAGVPRATLGTDPVPANLDAWFFSPANLRQLVERPTLCTNHPQAYLSTWNAASGRGWRGPYLSAAGLRLQFVDIGDNLAPDGQGEPTWGMELIEVPALPAGRERQPVVAGSYNPCANPGPTRCLLDFRTVKSRKGNNGSGDENPGYEDTLLNSHQLDHAGRPLLFLLAHWNGAATVRAPRIVDFGENGKYDGPPPLPALPATSNPCQPSGDDIVLCLE